jgi:predicted amidohydrolase YtcJ
MAGSLAPFAAGLVLLCADATGMAAADTLVFRHGEILTEDPTAPRAESLVTVGERIVYVGPDAGVAPWLASATRVIELNGQTVLPGFQDSHVHPGTVPNPARQVELHGLRTAAEISATIGRFAATHPDLPWIVGDGWDETAFLPSGQPDRATLDALVPDRPVFLTDNAGHEAWVNSRALAAAGLENQSADPKNGRLEHRADGSLSGVLQEDGAMDRVLQHIPAATDAETREDLMLGLAAMSAEGYTAVVDAMATPALVSAYMALAHAHTLPVRAQLCMPFDPLLDDEPQIAAFVAARAEAQGTGVRVDCVKLFLDGAYGSHTVALLAPYSDDPAQFGRGALFIEQGRLDRLADLLTRLGFVLHFHAQGDGAVRAALDALERTGRIPPPGSPRHTIAHLCLVDPADRPRFARLHVVANVSPLWALGDTWETDFAPRLFGPVRTAMLFPTRDLIAQGVDVVFGSDWPVTGVSALAGIETAVTHRYPGGIDPDGQADTTWHGEGRLSLREALTAATRNGARLWGDDEERGQLREGWLADLVVLNGTLSSTEPLAIHALGISLTVSAGRVVYTRPVADGSAPMP